MRSLAVPIGIGVAAGFVGGLFGVGGGVLIVPGLVLVLGFGQYRASGTSTATIAAAAAAALLLFGGSGQVDVVAAVWLFAGAGVGAAVGARFLEQVPAIWLTRGFAILIVTAALRMVTV